ncbi:MAG: hypothetical protein ABEJ58_01770 [Halodesulfurarchaeum sp.]
MRAIGAVVLALLLIVTPIAPAMGASAYVSVTDVTVRPETPLPGEDITITATVRNLESSPSNLELNAVAIQYTESHTVKEYTRAQDLGTLSPGSEIRVPLTISFEEPGTKSFRVVVYGQDESGASVKVTYPVVVQVSTAHPTVTIEADQPVTGVESPVNLTVSNGLDDSVRNVAVRLDGKSVTVDNSRRAIAKLESGEERVLSYRITPKSVGRQPLRATIRYTTAGGYDRVVKQTEWIQVEALSDRVELVATTVERANTRSIELEVTNLGNAALENVVLTGEAGNATVGRVVVPAIEPDSTTNVTLPVTDLVNETTATIVATYEIGTHRGRVQTETTVAPIPAETHPGRIVLTGIDFERENGNVRITGSASNVGLTPANSVLVRVRETAGVSPASPNREYFVGTVLASDFVSFDVFASVEGNVSTIPLEVTYLSEGKRHSRLVEVPYDIESPDQAESRPNDRGLLVPALVAGLVVVVLAGVIFLGWRNYRGGD